MDYETQAQLRSDLLELSERLLSVESSPLQVDPVREVRILNRQLMTLTHIVERVLDEISVA